MTACHQRNGFGESDIFDMPAGSLLNRVRRSFAFQNLVPYGRSLCFVGIVQVDAGGIFPETAWVMPVASMFSVTR